MLSRTVRFCINPDGSLAGGNGYAGRPAMSGLGRFYELTVTVAGSPDPQTGYIIGIQEIDSAARSVVLPLIAETCQIAPHTEPLAMLADLWARASAELPRDLVRIRWNLTPTYSVEINMPDTQTPMVLVRQRFDFAAAHRLHASELSDEENRRIFGKCNNPSGHGHNYQIETAVRIPGDQAHRFNLNRLEELVDEAVVEPFDHKHLNEDCPEFDQGSDGVIPSVERIAMVCYDRLANRIGTLLPGAELAEVTVWETDRTSCTYPAS